MNKGKFKLAISVLLILLIVSFMVTLCWGTYKVSPMEVINTLLGNGTKLQNTAILTIRVPRLLVGMFVAIALSTAGAILQTITKNDLADTGIIGINAGAAVAAVLFITYSTGAYYSELGQLSIFVLPVIAIIGAAVTAFVIYMMSSRKGIKPKRLLLIGIGLNAGLNAFITFFTFRGGVGDYNRILVWTSGSLWGSGWSYAKVIIPIVTLMFIIVLLNHKKLDVLNLSDELAISLGLNLEKERKKQRENSIKINTFIRLDKSSASEIDKQIEQTYLSLQKNIKFVCTNKDLMNSMLDELDYIIYASKLYGGKHVMEELDNRYKNKLMS